MYVAPLLLLLQFECEEGSDGGGVMSEEVCGESDKFVLACEAASMSSPFMASFLTGSLPLKVSTLRRFFLDLSELAASPSGTSAALVFKDLLKLLFSLESACRLP